MRRYKLRMKSESMQVNILQTESNLGNELLMRSEKMYTAQGWEKNKTNTHVSIGKNSS